MKSNPLAIVAGFATLASPLFAEVDISKLPAPATKAGVTYANDIRPILQGTCFRCHGEERQKAKLRLDSLEAALKGSENGKVIISGKSAESPLVIAVSQLDPEKAMPPKRGPGGPGGRGPGGAGTNRNTPGGGGGGGGVGQSGAGRRPGGFGGPGGGPMSKPLTAEQVGLIRAWIDQGAK